MLACLWVLKDVSCGNCVPQTVKYCSFGLNNLREKCCLQISQKDLIGYFLEFGDKNLVQFSKVLPNNFSHIKPVLHALTYILWKTKVEMVHSSLIGVPVCNEKNYLILILGENSRMCEESRYFYYRPCGLIICGRTKIQYGFKMHFHLFFKNIKKMKRCNIRYSTICNDVKISFLWKKCKTIGWFWIICKKGVCIQLAGNCKKARNSCTFITITLFPICKHIKWSH